MKIVVNRCWGGFGLSQEALEEIGIKYDFDVKRNDPKLVQVVERLGEAANGYLSNLRVIDIPDDVDWEIDDYDGMETIHEKHRSW